MLEQFPRLGSVISKDGNVIENVKCRVAKASKDLESSVQGYCVVGADV